MEYSRGNGHEHKLRAEGWTRITAYGKRVDTTACERSTINNGARRRRMLDTTPRENNMGEGVSMGTTANGTNIV